MVCNLKITRPGLVGGFYAGSTTYSPSGDRKYDVWGAVRGGNTTGYPNNRYCANLGHVVDDELGLIYMRARYYEPGTGRFISEDSARDGWTWYGYCSNNPVGSVDPSGNVSIQQTMLISFAGALFSLLTSFLVENGLRSISGVASDPVSSLITATLAMLVTIVADVSVGGRANNGKPIRDETLSKRMNTSMLKGSLVGALTGVTGFLLAWRAGQHLAQIVWHLLLIDHPDV